MSENNETTYVSLRNDLLFHMVFTRNEEALKGLLSVLLNIPEERIEKAEVLNPMQYSEAIDTKLTVLDLKVQLNDSTYILVEMQVRKFDEWINRTVVYTCRQVADQARDEFDYSKLEPVIQISIMDYTLFADHKRFFKAYRVADDEGYVYTDKIQFWVMDLTQVNEATEEQKAQGLVEWAKAFRADSWEEVNQIQNSAVKEAAKTMKLIMSNPTEREIIRMRQAAQNDWITMRNSERKAGMQEAKLEMARGLKRDGVDPAIIAKNSGLSLSEIAKL